MPKTTSDCDWCATDPTTGRFVSLSQRSDAQVLLQRVESLRERGSGYVEVARPEGPFPWLAFSFTCDKAVVHQFTAPEESFLLRGDGSMNSELQVEVPVYEEMSSFTGDYVSDVDRALGIVMRFAMGSDPDQLGDWEVP